MKGSTEKIFGVLAVTIVISVLIISGLALGNPNDFVNSVPVGNDNGEEDDDDALHAISWIAFCSNTGLSSSNILDLEENETNEDLEPISVDWETNANVDYIVIKYSTTVEIFHIEDGMSGTVKVGEGDSTKDFGAFKGDNYCTGYDESSSGVKFDWGNSPSPFFYNEEKDFWNS